MSSRVMAMAGALYCLIDMIKAENEKMPAIISTEAYNQPASETMTYWRKKIWGKDASIDEIERRIAINKAYALRHHPDYWYICRD